MAVFVILSKIACVDTSVANGFKGEIVMFFKTKIVLIVFFSLFIISCNDNEQSVNMNNLEEFKLTTNLKLPLGTSKKAVDDYLNSLRLEYSYLDDERTFYAIIPNVGSYRLMYTSSLLIRISLDDERKVEQIEYEIEHSGL